MRTKLTQFIALGASTRISNTQLELFRFVADDVESIKWWLDFFNINTFFSSGWRISASAFCVSKSDFCDMISKINNRGKIFEEGLFSINYQN